jgi:hypothetical protein
MFIPLFTRATTYSPTNFRVQFNRPSELKLSDPDGKSIGAAYDIGERILWRR